MAKVLEDLKNLMEEEQATQKPELEEQEEEHIEDDQEQALDDDAEQEPESDDDEQEESDDEDDQVESADDEPAKEESVDDEEIRIKKNEYYAMRRKAQKAEAPKNEAQESDGADDYENQLMQEALQEIKIKKATREFQDMESEFLRQSGAKDYEPVTEAYRNSVYHSMRVLNPRMSHNDLIDATRTQILTKASQYLNQGLDPIAELYFEAKELGFGAQKEEPKAEEEVKDEVPKVNLKKIAKNKKRSSGMAAAPSSGGASPSGKLTPKEFSNLSPEQKRAYLAS